MPLRKKSCPNLNHGRMNPPVRHCPACSAVVNARIAIPVCSEEKHARKRRDRSNFCSDCGERLID